ncbi:MULTISPECIES: methyltransferase domain-containing protein [Cupriavidus]|uniref:methyltransferase domain-containing protein n=2 Tax=unclassified Cupriavidus TaxID=2640874 RepID=UPI00044F4BF2|nr:methyltransferase domain-containing protein [Cupriavidus sp. SK-3]KDP87930.1 thiopurine S-methyltransferase [Cupriavidus sp. SK-3]
MAGPTIDFWQSRFESGQTPWERESASPQLQAWLAQGTIQAGERVIVPGCGGGWEVAALAAHGARVSGIDYAPGALARTVSRLKPSGLQADLEKADVLHWQPTAPVDAVYEQTCLCALHPDHWIRYASQLHAWLRPGGRLLALFMQMRRDSASQGMVEGPPYHCDINAMRALFPAQQWEWPKPPYSAVAHPSGAFELPVVLVRR